MPDELNPKVPEMKIIPDWESIFLEHTGGGFLITREQGEAMARRIEHLLKANNILAAQRDEAQARAGEKGKTLSNIREAMNQWRTVTSEPEDQLFDKLIRSIYPATEAVMIEEIAMCGACGETWTDTGDPVCPFCESSDTTVIRNEDAVGSDR